MKEIKYKSLKCANKRVNQLVAQVNDLYEKLDIERKYNYDKSQINDFKL